MRESVQNKMTDAVGVAVSGGLFAISLQDIATTAQQITQIIAFFIAILTVIHLVIQIKRKLDKSD